jgi:hypothetical protein
LLRLLRISCFCLYTVSGVFIIEKGYF